MKLHSCHDRSTSLSKGKYLAEIAVYKSYVSSHSSTVGLFTPLLVTPHTERSCSPITQEKTARVLAADESPGPSLNANLSETGISRNSFQKSIPCRLREDGQQTWICLALLHAVPSDALLGELWLIFNDHSWLCAIAKTVSGL